MPDKIMIAILLSRLSDDVLVTDGFGAGGFGAGMVRIDHHLSSIYIKHNEVQVSTNELSLRLFAHQIHRAAIVALTLEAVRLAEQVRWAIYDYAIAQEIEEFER